MYDFRVDAKLRRKTGLLCSLAGALVFFGIAFLLYPIYAFYSGDPVDAPGVPGKSNGFRRVVSSSGQARIQMNTASSSGSSRGFSMVINQGTVSTIFALLGAGIGFGISNEVTRGIQRRRELAQLIEQGKEIR